MVPGAYSVGTQRALKGCDRLKREGPGGCVLAGRAHMLERARPGRVAGPASGTKRCHHDGCACRYGDKAVAKMVFVLSRIGFWLVVSWALHKRRWYWKF